MELMDLPTWLRLNKAVCNKVNVKVSASAGDSHYALLLSVNLPEALFGLLCFQ